MQKPVSGHRLLNLWEMMKLFKLREFAFALLELHDLMRQCETFRQSGVSVFPSPSVPDEFVQKVIEAWKVTLGLCEDIKLENAAKALRMVTIHLQSYSEGQTDYSSLSADFRRVFDTITSDFWNRQFIQISEEHGKYVNNHALLGDDIATAFPNAVLDLREAGNCLAVDSSTAAVFHLMRAVEWALRSFCQHLGVKQIPKSKKPGNTKFVPVEYSQWEKILIEARERVDGKIDRMPPGEKKQSAQEFYYPLLQDLSGFKDAWRNHVMHTRQVYTAKDAEAIMDHVKRFMSLLATRVS